MPENLRIKHVSADDAIVVLDIIDDSLTCSSQEKLIPLLSRLGTLIEYKAAVCAIVTISDDGEGQEAKIVNLDYPEEYLSELSRRGLIMKDPILSENFRTFSMQYWADTLAQTPWSSSVSEILSLGEDYGFHKAREGRGYGYGVRNFRGTEGSFFCYQEMNRCSRTEEILRLVIPHFHEALLRTERSSKTHLRLTQKETEVIKWIKEGKSTWDISAILGISERTVKFHVGNIMQKLDAVSRTHAVAKAMDQGLI